MAGDIPAIGFLGAGQMARALARGWLAAGLARIDRLRASDPEPRARQAFFDQVGVPVSTRSQEVVQGCEVVVLAVKPQSMSSLLAEIRPAVTPDQLFVSIAAGVTLQQLEEGLGSRRLIRVMPNTPCLVGESASAYCPGESATPQDVAL